MGGTDDTPEPKMPCASTKVPPVGMTQFCGLLQGRRAFASVSARTLTLSRFGLCQTDELIGGADSRLCGVGPELTS